jgi:hypothetical protein
MGILEALLPDRHRMVPSFYLLRRFLRSSLHDVVDQKDSTILHMCREPHCGHLYPAPDQQPPQPDDQCPSCGTTRFECVPALCPP